jgi:GntR family transcriptional regulator/MocR family aminotransferase
MFLHRGAVAAIEDPGFQGAASAFEATGSETVGVAVDRDGLIPEDLPKRATALLYVTPSHQFPTGHVLSAKRREVVIQWARRCGCYILEDDSDGEFRYEGSPLPAIAASASDCTIYLGTFSRTLGAGLRLGFMVVPPRLAPATAAAKALLNSGNSWLEQAALAEMMQTNSYAAHLARIRAHYRENRDCLIAALRRSFGEVSVSGEAGGLHLLWYLPPGVPDAPVVEALARRVRVGVYPIAQGGAVAARPSMLDRRAVMLGFGALLPKQIDQGIDRLSEVIDDAVDDLKADVNELLVNPPVSLIAPARPAGRTPAMLDSRFRRQPALAKHRRLRPPSHRIPAREAKTSMAVVTRIYHYPIKGLSAQPLSRVIIEAAKPIADDRVFALARPGAPIDRHDPKWAKKGLFAMLMLDEGLAGVTTHLDLETTRLTVKRGAVLAASGRLHDEAEREELENFLWTLLPGFQAPPTLVRSRGGHFMDKPDEVVSLINLATVRSLEEQWGVAIDPLRFRANFYIDGARPWEEFDWIGGDLHIGEAVFAVDRKNGRCGATNVNPATGRRDLDIPGSLRSAFGHKNLGVYLVARKDGAVAVGDTASTPDAASRSNRAPEKSAAMEPRRRRFMCRGCYFIYEEDLGLPQQGIGAGTPFDAIPADWRCPDCGSEKSVFRPYLDPMAARA